MTDNTKTKIYSLSDNKRKNNEMLKLLAILFMVIDHIGAIIYPDTELFRVIGRLAFPIFAYQLAQGYAHTSNYNKYMFRLWIFAIISQIPYTLAFDTLRLNVMFTFVIALFLIDKVAKKEYYWLFSVLALVYFVEIDYSLYGILLPVAFYIFKDKKMWAFILTSIMTVIYMLYLQQFIVVYALIGIAIALYLPRNEVKVKMNKYFFYWFYPIHISILFGIKICVITFLLK